MKYRLYLLSVNCALLHRPFPASFREGRLPRPAGLKPKYEVQEAYLASRWHLVPNPEKGA